MSSTLVINSFSIQASSPPFNLGYLAGLLKKNNIPEVSIIDINLIIWDYLYSADFLKTLSYNKELLSDNIYCQPICYRGFVALKENTIKNIDIAKNIIKSKEFYSFPKFIWAQKILYDASCIIYYSSGTFFTSHIPYWSKIGVEFKDIEKIYKTSQDLVTNPLIAIIEKKIIPLILEIEPSLILVDIMFPWDITASLTANTIIKKYLPNVHINYPGQGFDEFCFSRIADELQNDKKLFFGFDSIFTFRNDAGIISLVKNHQVKQGLNGINNLFYLENNTIQTNIIENRSTIDDDILPNYDWADFEKYLIPEPLIVDRLSYKCFWSRCSYCSINLNKLVGTTVNLNRQISKLKTYSDKYGVVHFWFLDEGCPIDVAVSFAEKIIQEGIKIVWSLRTRVNEDITFEKMHILYKSGLREFWMGLEHVNANILDKMNKSSNPIKYKSIAKQIVEDATSLGIGIHFCHILGFPSETDEQRKEVNEFYKSLSFAIKRKPFFCTFNLFGLMYGSDMYKKPKKYGITSISKEKNEFNMISIPYTSKWNDETNNPDVLSKLNNWVKLYSKHFIKYKPLTYFWYTMSGTPYELMFKKHYNYNPFTVSFKYKYIIILIMRQLSYKRFGKLTNILSNLEKKIFHIN